MTDPTPSAAMSGAADLAALFVHDFNPRKSADDADHDIATLAKSIAEAGLEYPLAALDTGDGRFGVVDGRRRLMALRALAENPDQDPAGHAAQPIPLRVTRDPAQARAWAMIPVTTVKGLHPADEIRAYAEEARSGTAPDRIARAYGVPAAHVQRRLKLASLSETTLDALKSDKISLDTAKALTLARTPDAEAEALDTLLKSGDAIYNPPNWVRRQLATGAVEATDRRARFVGLGLYKAEGGTLTEDLFTDGSVLHDEALLDRLFARELEHQTETIRAEEGWSWAQTLDAEYAPWDAYEKFDRLHRTPAELSDADQTELDRLGDMDPETCSDDELARYDALEKRTRGDFTDAQREIGGIICYVNTRGQLIVERAFAEKGARRTTNDDDDSGAAGAANAPEPAAPKVNGACAEDLNRIRLIALQTALLKKPELLLDVLAFQLEHAISAGHRAIAIEPSWPSITVNNDSNLTIDARLGEVPVTPNWQAPHDADALARFQGHGKKHRNQVLATALARCVQNSPMWQTLWSLSAPDVRKIWSPDAANLFKHMRADALDALWQELTGLAEDAPEIAEFVKLKKARKTERLEALFSDMSVREALGLSRDQNAIIDAWTPPIMAVPDAGSIDSAEATP